MSLYKRSEVAVQLSTRMASSTFGNRKYKNKLVLFDVDGTLTRARQVCCRFIIDLSLVERLPGGFARNDRGPAQP